MASQQAYIALQNSIDAVRVMQGVERAKPSRRYSGREQVWIMWMLKQGVMNFQVWLSFAFSSLMKAEGPTTIWIPLSNFMI